MYNRVYGRYDDQASMTPRHVSVDISKIRETLRGYLFLSIKAYTAREVRERLIEQRDRK